MDDRGGSILLPQDLGIGKLYEAVRDAVVVTDAHTGRIVLWNPAASKIFGYSRSEALGLFVEALIPRHLRDRHRGGLDRYRRTGTGRYVDYSDKLLELPALRKGGEEILIEMSLSAVGPADHEPNGWHYALAIIRDVTERKRLEERLAYLAYHDELTGLANRASFLERLEGAIARADREGTGVAVLYLDLDLFKEVNDSFGHGAGDELLKALLGGRARGVLRDSQRRGCGQAPRRGNFRREAPTASRLGDVPEEGACPLGVSHEFRRTPCTRSSENCPSTHSSGEYGARRGKRKSRSY